MRNRRRPDLLTILKRNDVEKHSFLVLALVLTYIPFWLMVVISVKDQAQFYHGIWLPDFPLHPENYGLAWGVVSRYLMNSIFVTVTTIVGVLLVSSLSAFVFARYDFPGKKLLFLMIISLLMVPAILTMVPAFVWVKNLGMINSHWGLILPGIAGQQVFAIFILRSNMASLPEELFEAARVDGASIFQCYWRIALPLSRPILSVVVITTLLSTWNDFIWPLIVISDDKLRTIPIGLAFFQGQYITQYGPQMAGYVISSIPLLLIFIFTSKEFVQGLTAGAIKF
jgi:ABC-type glycerol-3-phosphate transport system permease component